MPDDDEFAEFDFDEEEFEMKDDGRGGSKKQQQQQQVGSMIQSQESVKFTPISKFAKRYFIVVHWSYGIFKLKLYY